MSIQIAIQACCQVFQINYDNLRENEIGRTSTFITERKFSVYWISEFVTQRDLNSCLNISTPMAMAYKTCIRELIEEDTRHAVIIETLEAKYAEIQAKRMGAWLSHTAGVYENE